MKDDYRCFFCNGEADRIAYYSKSYGSKMGYTIENPTICCRTCYQSPRIMNQINSTRGGDEGIFSFTFKKIGEWDNKELAYHLSQKLWEINHLSTRLWKKLIWRIHFTNKPRKNSNEDKTEERVLTL